MLGGCLNAVSDAFIAEETHYFGDLRKRTRIGGSAKLTEANRKLAEDYFLALTHRHYGDAGDPERGTMARADLRNFAMQLGDTPDAFFEAFCRIQAEEQGRSRWGEKTPRHVFEIAEILNLYPSANVICMIRDPRAVVASYRDFKKGEIEDSPDDPGRKEALRREQRRVQLSYHVVVASLMWRAVARTTQAALDRFGPERICVLRYEDLVDDSEGALGALTSWLGVRFDPALLSTVPIGTSSYSGLQSDVGISGAAAQRWREKMTPAEIRTVQLCSGKTASDFGYEALDERVSPFSLILPWLSLPWVSIRVVWVNRSRLGGILGYIKRRLHALVQG
jgi:hypothetical protein